MEMTVMPEQHGVLGPGNQHYNRDHNLHAGGKFKRTARAMQSF
jgi:hypothetical protein